MNKFILLVITFLSVSIYAHARVVTDQNHIAVDVPDEVSRIITIPIPMASMVITVDESSRRLVAINRSSHNDFVEGFLSKIYPEVVNIPYDIASDGFVPNVETLVKLHPDVVIQWGDRGDAIVKPIKDTGLPVLTMIYGDTDYVPEWIRMTGALLNKPQRAHQLADWFSTQYKAMQEKAKKFTDGRKPKVVYFYNYSSGLVTTGSGTSYQGDIVVAGGDNEAEKLSGFAPVNIEQLLIWNPDIILLNNSEVGVTPQVIYQDKRLQNVSAVINKKVYVYPSGGFRWGPPSQESILSLQWLSLLFHPRQAEKDFRQQMRDTYQLLYHYQLTDNDIDNILRIKDNAGSANYCQLFCQHSSQDPS